MTAMPLPTTARPGRPALSVRIPPCAPVPEIAALVLRCEGLGFDGVWLPDSQMLWRDPFLAAHAALEATSSINIGIAVTNVVTRHVSVVSGLIRTLAENHPGRVRIGLGVGSSSTGTVALRASTTAEMRSAFVTLRALAAGTAHDFGAGSIAQEGAGVATPLYMAATGPRNLSTAGEIADGLIVLNGAAPESLRKTLAIVADGEEVRSPSLGSLRRMVTSFCLPTTDPERDARRLKPLCVAMARHLGAAGALAERGITVRPGGPSRPVKPDLMHPKDWDGAIDAVDHLVSDQDALAFGRAFCLFGSLEEISSQLEEMRTMEVEEVMLQELESFRLPHRWVQECAVLTRPRSAGGPDTSIDQVQRG